MSSFSSDDDNDDSNKSNGSDNLSKLSNVSKISKLSKEHKKKHPSKGGSIQKEILSKQKPSSLYESYESSINTYVNSLSLNTEDINMFD
jgi:hypothetical protein